EEPVQTDEELAEVFLAIDVGISPLVASVELELLGNDEQTALDLEAELVGVATHAEVDIGVVQRAEQVGAAEVGGGVSGQQERLVAGGVLALRVGGNAEEQTELVAVPAHHVIELLPVAGELELGSARKGPV